MQGPPPQEEKRDFFEEFLAYHHYEEIKRPMGDAPEVINDLGERLADPIFAAFEI